MATITPANLSYKDKDGDLGEVKSLTDTDVTLLNNALQDIEDLKLAYSPGFVKRDFSNVTQDGKNASVGWGSLDFTRAIDIRSLATNGAVYEAPFDGYITGQFNVDANGSFLIAYGNTFDYSRVISGGANSGNFTVAFCVFTRINKGQSYTFLNVSARFNSLLAIPCKGV